MSIPSITIRLDFGEGISSGISHGITLQGEIPTPMGSGSGLAGVTNAEPPTPFVNIAAAPAQGSVPTPMPGIGGMSAAMTAPPEPSLAIGGMSAAMTAPPEPSLAIANARTSGVTDDMPHPEGHPEAAKKQSGKR